MSARAAVRERRRDVGGGGAAPVVRPVTDAAPVVRPLTDPAPVGACAAGERDLVVALQAGDERVFTELVERYSPVMLRVAQLHVPTRAVAEEVVQETWMGVIESIGRFRGDCSLRTWMFRILTNRAKTRGRREQRSRPFSAIESVREHGSAVEPERFAEAGHWITPPRTWEGAPEERLLSAETRERLRTAVDALPPRQRTVLTLRDVHGWTAAEVREAMDLSEGNQRVLLHRARSAVRRELEQYLDGR